MDWYPILFIVGIVVAWLIGKLVRDLWRGYTISFWGAPPSDLVYKERGKGSLTLHYEMGSGEVYVPSKTEWQEQMPMWAKDRREQIMQRIVKDHKWDKSLRYIGYEPEP